MTSEGLTRPGRADHSGEDFGVVFLSWLGLIIGWVILAALRRRLDPGDPGPPDAPRSPARPATTALVQPAPVHRDRRCGPRHGKAAAAIDRMVGPAPIHRQGPRPNDPDRPPQSLRSSAANDPHP